MLDKPARLCYTILRKREEDARMADWYMNPEIHADDYEELQNLLRELAEEEADEEPEG